MTGYPIGSFLFWKISRENCDEYVFYEFMTDYHQRERRHLERAVIGEPRDLVAILDGQQRLTALNIGLYGSHAEKVRYARVNNPHAYPKRYLYLNIVDYAEENEMGMEYDFRFLTPERAEQLNGENQHWFPVSRIRSLEAGEDVYDYVDENIGRNRFAFSTLTRLHDVVHKDQIINYFEEESQDLDKVLNIFIRVNSGGTELSYSDLLLSIATAQWKELDAREEIHGLIDQLNQTGHGFEFSKDIVLKAGLMLSDIQSIAFRVTNFNARNMALLEQNWSKISRALRLAVQFLTNCGFSSQNLPANSVLIPIAYYFALRNVSESYLTATSERADRERVQQFVIRSIAKRGIWGSGLDTLLLGLRTALREHGESSFPVDQIETAMSRIGKSLRFDEDELEDLLDLSFGDRRVFSVLALLYPGMEFWNEFHVDHIFPRKLLQRRALRNAGVREEQIDEYVDRCDRLPNLQLIPGTVNTQKSAEMPHVWLEKQYRDELARNDYRARHDLGQLPEHICGFHEFWDARRERLAQRLRAALGVEASQERISNEEMKYIDAEDEEESLAG